MVKTDLHPKVGPWNKFYGKTLSSITPATPLIFQLFYPNTSSIDLSSLNTYSKFPTPQMRYHARIFATCSNDHTVEHNSKFISILKWIPWEK